MTYITHKTSQTYLNVDQIPNKSTFIKTYLRPPVGIQFMSLHVNVYDFNFGKEIKMAGVLESLRKWTVEQPEKTALSFLDSGGSVSESMTYNELRCVHIP